MIKLRQGNQVHQLLQLLSVAGEFPAKSLAILGNEQFLKRTVHKLESAQEIRSDTSGLCYNQKLFTVSGTRDKRTVRLYKGALPILNELHPDALDRFLEAFPDNKFSGNLSHILRNHRVGEALAVCMMVGIEIRPYVLPVLQKKEIRRTIPETICYYTARGIKKLDVTELNKTIYTRMVGALFYPGEMRCDVYAVYNTRNAVMKWSGVGELKAKHDLTEIARMNCGIDEVDSAVLFGENSDVALSTLIESDKTKRMELRFDRIYHHVHFVPMNRDGIRLLKILTLPDWKEKLLSALLPPRMRPKGYGFMEYDAYWEGKYILSHIDGDIARLIRFNEALGNQKGAFEVLCLPWQVKFLREYLKDRVALKVYDMDLIEKALEVKVW